MGGDWFDDCKWNFSSPIIPSLPAVTIPIPKSAAVGDLVGGWWTNGSTSLGGSSALGEGNGGWDTFYICTPWQRMRSTGTTSNTEDYLWVTGSKPAGVYESPDVSSVDASSSDGSVNSYTVWTTNALSSVGVGFILRWRAQASGSGVGEGAWRYPPSGWGVDVPLSSAGFPFYQSTFIEHYLGNCDPGWYPNFSSLVDFRNSPEVSGCTQTTGSGVAYYGAQVEVRYVLTKPASSIYSELDDNSKTITTNFVILKGRQAWSSGTGQATVRQSVTVRLPPTQTCQSPSVEEGTVHFGSVRC